MKRFCFFVVIVFILLAYVNVEAISITDSISPSNDNSMPFPTTLVGMNSAAETLTIANDGTTDLTLQDIILTGDFPSNFTIDVNGGSTPCGTLPVVLTAGQSCTITVTFVPEYTDTHNATLIINSDDSTNPSYEINLSGDGISPFVYVSNADSDTVSVIDPVTNTVIATIDVQGTEPRNLAATPDGSKIYVPVRHSDQVTVIDVNTNTVTAVITDSSFYEPYAIAVTPDGSEAWVANKEGGGSYTGSISIINTSTNKVVATIDDDCFASPEGIAMNPVQPRAYVANRYDGTVCIVDTLNRTF